MPTEGIDYPDVQVRRLRRARPSVQEQAENCARAPWLGANYRENDSAKAEGSAVDAEVTEALAGGERPERKVSGQLLDWARRRFPESAIFYPQHKVILRDPDTGEIISEGTADLVVVFEISLIDGAAGEPLGPVRRCVVVDWKKKGQLFAGYLSSPDHSLQQWNYVLGAAMEFGCTEGQIILACWDDSGVTPIEGEIWPDTEWDPVLARIKAIPPFDPYGPEPEANKGSHCKKCWQKVHCSAYLAPALSGPVPVALRPFMEGRAAEMTAEDAAAGLRWLEDAAEAITAANLVRGLVKSQLETWTSLRGPIVEGDRQWGPAPGLTDRKPPTLAHLESIQRFDLIRPGEATTVYKWRAVPGTARKRRKKAPAAEVGASAPSPIEWGETESWPRPALAEVEGAKVLAFVTPPGSNEDPT